MSSRHIVKRQPTRGVYDRDTVRDVLDDGIVCHVGFVQDGMPIVIPMLYARDGDRLLLHGSVASRLLRELSKGLEVSIAVTHLDGLVLAASVFDHSANYRSAVIFGKAKVIDDPESKARAFDRLVEFMIPGRSGHARPANRKETSATTVLEVPINTFSVKQRTGPAGPAAAGDPSTVWTGVIPLFIAVGEAQSEQNPGAIPEYVSNYCPDSTRLKDDKL